MTAEIGGSFWEIHHLNEGRKTKEFYARLEAGVNITMMGKWHILDSFLVGDD
jgi:hypothetical protein